MSTDLDHQTIFDDLCEHSGHSACVLAIEMALVVVCLAVAFLL